MGEDGTTVKRLCSAVLTVCRLSPAAAAPAVVQGSKPIGAVVSPVGFNRPIRVARRRGSSPETAWP